MSFLFWGAGRPVFPTMAGKHTFRAVYMSNMTHLWGTLLPVVNLSTCGAIRSFDTVSMFREVCHAGISISPSWMHCHSSADVSLTVKWIVHAPIPVGAPVIPSSLTTSARALCSSSHACFLTCGSFVLNFVRFPLGIVSCIILGALPTGGSFHPYLCTMLWLCLLTFSLITIFVITMSRSCCPCSWVFRTSCPQSSEHTFGPIFVALL